MTVEQRHARVLLCRRAKGMNISGDNLGLPKRGVWPAVDGRKGGGTIFYCADCREWVIGVTRQHHRGGAGHDKQVRVAAARGREEELKGNYRKRQRADIHRVSRGQAPKGPLPPEEWDVLTPSLTPGQAAAMATAEETETAAGGEGVENLVGLVGSVEKQRLDAEAAVDAFYKADVD